MLGPRFIFPLLLKAVDPHNLLFWLLSRSSHVVDPPNYFTLTFLATHMHVVLDQDQCTLMLYAHIANSTLLCILDGF
jgi:hypothetical protein